MANLCENYVVIFDHSTNREFITEVERVTNSEEFKSKGFFTCIWENAKQSPYVGEDIDPDIHPCDDHVVLVYDTNWKPLQKTTWDMLLSLYDVKIDVMWAEMGSDIAGRETIDNLSYRTDISAYYPGIFRLHDDPDYALEKICELVEREKSLESAKELMRDIYGQFVEDDTSVDDLSQILGCMCETCLLTVNNLEAKIGLIPEEDITDLMDEIIELYETN